MKQKEKNRGVHLHLTTTHIVGLLLIIVLIGGFVVSNYFYQKEKQQQEIQEALNKYGSYADRLNMVMKNYNKLIANINDAQLNSKITSEQMQRLTIEHKNFVERNRPIIDEANQFIFQNWGLLQKSGINIDETQRTINEVLNLFQENQQIFEQKAQAHKVIEEWNDALNRN